MIVPFALIALTAALFGGVEALRRDQPVAVVIAEGAAVRAAPYGVANATATLSAGSALVVGRSYGPWREVSRTDGIHGWVLEGEIAAL